MQNENTSSNANIEMPEMSFICPTLRKLTRYSSTNVSLCVSMFEYMCVRSISISTSNALLRVSVAFVLVTGVCCGIGLSISKSNFPSLILRKMSMNSLWSIALSFLNANKYNSNTSFSVQREWSFACTSFNEEKERSTPAVDTGSGPYYEQLRQVREMLVCIVVFHHWRMDVTLIREGHEYAVRTA